MLRQPKSQRLIKVTDSRELLLPETEKACITCLLNLKTNLAFKTSLENALFPKLLIMYQLVYRNVEYVRCNKQDININLTSLIATHEEADSVSFCTVRFYNFMSMSSNIVIASNVGQLT